MEHDASDRLEFSPVKQHGMCLFVYLDRFYVARISPRGAAWMIDGPTIPSCDVPSEE
jgi:hypothetical protein